MKTVKYIILGIVLLFGISTQAQDTLSYPMDTIDGKIYYRYLVPRGVGIYRIGVNFGVSQEEILKANPQLLTKGIRYDQELLIPTKLTVESKQDEAIAETPTKVISVSSNEEPIAEPAIVSSHKPVRRTRKAIKDSLAHVQDSIMMHDSLYNDSIQREKETYVIRLAIMLPLYADAVKRDKNMDRFFDFYAGSLLAINEVQQEGQRIELFTYDVDKTTTAVKLVMQDSARQKVDAIIGPAYPQQVAVVNHYAQQDSTWILVPFLPSLAEMKNNPYILKFNPSTEVAAKAMAEYLSQLGDEVNCVLLESKETDNVPAGIAQLHREFEEYNIPTTITNIRQIYTDSIDSVFVEGKENIVIFNTENYNNIQALIPNLVQASTKYQITLYSQYSWLNKNIVLPQLYTSAFSEELQVSEAYQLAFQKYFGHELSSVLPRYDLLGYDLTLHLLRMLQQAHKENRTLPTDNIWEGTQANIQYKQVSPQGGYENQTIYVIRK